MTKPQPSPRLVERAYRTVPPQIKDPRGEMYKVVGSVQPVSEESKETCYEIDREGASCPVGEAGDSLRGVKDGRCVLSEDYVCAVVHRDDGR